MNMIFFCKNLAQTKVYGPSLAMTDDWEEHITQLGLTKTVHEYVIYQLLSTAEGWTAWRDFLPGQFADQQLLLTRAIRLIEAANIRPAHARPPHPTWTTAIMQIFRCYHPQCKHLFLKSCFPQLVTTAAASGFRDVNVHGFSAGSYTGLAVHEILSAFAVFPGLTKVAAIATPPEMMRLATGERTVTLVHCLEDRLCVWKPDSLTEFNYQIVLIEGHPTWSVLNTPMATCSSLILTKGFMKSKVAQANQSRLPLAMGIVQPHIPVRRMASERKTQLTDALVRILSRFLTLAAISMDGAHDSYYREHLLPLAAHGDGHVLTVSIALLLAIMTGRSDLCIAGVFGAGKTRSLAVLLIALSCELNDFVAIVSLKRM